MDNNYDNLKGFIDRMKSITFLERLFRWKMIQTQLMNAVADLQKMTSNLGHLLSINSDLKGNNSNLAKDLELSKTQAGSLSQEVQSLREMKEELIKLKSKEEARQTKYENDVAILNSIRDGIQKERNEEVQAMVDADVQKLKGLKDTWSKHQTNVKSTIKAICHKHTIDYIEKVPFKGEPDNAIKICAEHVVFDAKSPAGDDLTNFPNYLKDQAEKAKKYAKQDGVKKDVFFVVPTNTLEKLTQFVFNLGDHDVYIISVDSLEQILLSLKKIEQYEFAENLSPEERDNICRVLGKFVHLTKRRIQIDSFFTKRFLELAYQSEADLPPDFLDRVNEFEKAEKINPPQEKRAKAIPIKELEKDTTRLTSDVATKGIAINADKISKGIDDLQLYEPTT